MDRQGRIIGIDLGTTYSAVAVFNETQGRFVVIRSRTGTSTTPSVVSYKDGEILVGTAAKARLSSAPTETIAEIKRHMGEPVRDEQGSPRRGPDDNPVPYTVEFAGKTHTPHMISAYLLKDLKEQAEQFLGAPVTGAVITVPAYFQENARRATHEAGGLAGLEVKCLVSEPTAAAIAFGMDEKHYDDDDEDFDDVEHARRILVYDLGGGTFDVSIIEIMGRNIEVKGVDGDHYLGGIDFDRAIVDWVLTKIRVEHDVDLKRTDGLTPDEAKMFKSAYHRIYGEAEKLKIALSNERSTAVSLPYLFMHPVSKAMVNVEYTLSRNEFLLMVKGLLRKTIATVDRALAAVDLRREDIDDVLLVGGSTRIPKIRNMLESHFGKPPRTDVHPDECVALGAAMQALRYTDTTAIPLEMEEKIEEQIEQMGQVLDITGHSLGVREGRNNMSVLIPKNSLIPASAEQTYQTASDHQTSVQVAVYQGEEPSASNNSLLTKFELHDLPPLPAGDMRIKIRFALDINGVLSVDATNMIDGTSASINTEYGGATTTRPEDLVASTKSSPVASRGPAIPAEHLDMYGKAQEVLPTLAGDERATLTRVLEAFMRVVEQGDTKMIAKRGDELMDTLFDVMPDE